MSASAAAAAAAIAEIAQLAEGDEPMPSSDEVDVELADALAASVGQLSALLRGHGAFDVMAMLSQFLMPPDFALRPESESGVESSWAPAEVVALTPLGLGLPSHTAGNETRTASIVPEAVARAAAIVRLSDVAGINALAATQRFALATVAWRLRSFETRVRGRHYESVAGRLNDAILGRPGVTEIWQSEIGYSFAAVMAVRTAVAGIVADAQRAARDQLAAGAQLGVPEPDEATRAALENLFETPSSFSTVTVDRVAAESSTAAEIVRSILDHFSIHVDGRSSLDLVSAFVAGRNPMAGRAMLAADGLYLPLPGAISADEIRRTGESRLKSSRRWVAYDRQRARGAEDLAAEGIAQLLGGQGQAWAQIKYRAHGDSKPEIDLSASSTTADRADLVESDLLCVLDGVAFCVEVKAGGLRPETREGGIAQLGGDLKKTVQGAAEQADRLRQLITTQHGVWLDDGKWLDLSAVQEIHSIVVCLDDFGPATLMLEELIRNNTLTQTHLPWIVSLNRPGVSGDLNG